MYQQVSRLDPANKSLAFAGFTENDAEKRCRIIENILEKIGCKERLQNIDHVWQGPPGGRKMSALSVVELISNSVREASLKKLPEGNSILKGDFGEIKVNRAKTAMQLKRNGALQRACDLIKKDRRAQGKSVTIEWKIENSKDRGVKMDGQTIFLQKVTELTGQFLAPFQDVTL